MSNTGGLLSILGLLTLVALAIVVVRSGVGGSIVTAWCTIAMTLKAIVLVPWGIFLLVVGLSIIWHWGGLFSWLIGGCLAFHGGNSLFGSLAGFVTLPSGSDTTEGATTATRADLRRAGLLRGDR